MRKFEWKDWVGPKSALWIFGCATLLFGAKSLQDSPTLNGYFRKLASSGSDCITPLATPVTFESLKNRVSLCGLKSVEETLAALPDSYRSSFTLMRKSKSAQDALGDNPRVILFGSDAKLILTFNGDSSQKGYNELEAIQFNDESKQFDFHQVTFAANKNSPASFDSNIQSCTTCHRTPARPNWEAYDVWEGAYGQVEDQIKVGSEEDQAFQGFILRSRNKGRYHYLVGSSDLRAPSIENLGEDRGGLAPGQKPTAYSVNTLPNFRLTFFLNRLNYQRIAALISATPDFATYKYAYYAALFGCGPIQDFIPQEIASHFTMTYDQMFQDTMQKLANQFATRLKEDGPFDSFKVFDNNVAPQNFEATSASRFIIAKLRYLTEGRGLSDADWSLSPIKDAWIFSDGELYLKEVARSFEPDLKSINGLVLDYVSLNDYSTMTNILGDHAQDFKGLSRLSCCNYDAGGQQLPSNNCTILKKLSLSAFQASGANIGSQISAPTYSDADSSRLRKPEELANTCIGCHSVNNGSGLVFKDLAALKGMLEKSGYPHGTLGDEIQFRLATDGDNKMPPYAGLMSNNERTQLADFLKSK